MRIGDLGIAKVLGVGGVFFKSSDPIGWFVDPDGINVEL